MFATGPLSAVRHAMWGSLMLAGIAWLAIGWSVLRLEPADIVTAAGLVVLFGALTETLRACAGARTWWMNAAMSLLFTVTGVLLLTAQTSSYTAPAALVGWYLMVRGAVDVAVAMMTRETDKVWGLIMVVGVLEALLGFVSAAPLTRTADLVVSVVGGLGLLRGVADLVTGLRLREVRAARATVLDLPPERAEGLTGYTAGMVDFDAAPPRASATARHRAASRAASPLLPAAPPDAMWPHGPSEHGLGGAGGGPAATAEAGITAAGGMAAAGYVAASGDMPEAGPMIVPSPEASPASPSAASHSPASHVPAAATTWNAATGPDAVGATAAATTGSGDEFHQEVLRTTADLDAMLALAGVTGAAVGHQYEHEDLPEVPDTPEGVDSPAESTGKPHPAA
ncbi:HdeD family acid-resistance protein [Actinoplanes sp. NPDC049265]|uniref:HdeD family acid-resistance protein n=1 Tax=Actinoplanes sp. NPDC049265 TaxID=3363902 RepID=UPI00370F82CB